MTDQTTSAPLSPGGDFRSGASGERVIGSQMSAVRLLVARGSAGDLGGHGANDALGWPGNLVSFMRGQGDE